MFINPAARDNLCTLSTISCSFCPKLSCGFSTFTCIIFFAIQREIAKEKKGPMKPTRILTIIKFQYLILTPVTLFSSYRLIPLKEDRIYYTLMLDDITKL